MKPARELALLGLALLQLGCLSHWQAQRDPAAEVVAAKQPERVRVTLTDSTRLDLSRPRLVGDSLEGLSADTSVTLPMDRVAHVAIRKPGASTPVVVFGAAALMGMVLYLTTIWEPY